MAEGLFDGLLRLGNRQVETPPSHRRHTRKDTDTPIRSSRHADSPLTSSHNRGTRAFDDTIRYPELQSWFHSLDARPTCTIPGVSWTEIGQQFTKQQITQINHLSLMPLDVLQSTCGSKPVAIILEGLVKEEMSRLRR